MLHQGDRPLLQRLRKDGVISVAEGLLYNCKNLVTLKDESFVTTHCSMHRPNLDPQYRPISSEAQEWPELGEYR